MSQFGLSESATDQILRVLAQHSSIEKTLLYGSRAKGTQKTGSDIDLALIGSISVRELMQIADELDELPLPYQFDLTIFEKIDNPDLVDHIGRVGKLFYCRSKDDM